MKTGKREPLFGRQPLNCKIRCTLQKSYSALRFLIAQTHKISPHEERHFTELRLHRTTRL